MGLFDIFKKLPLEERMENYANKGLIGKLEDAADESSPKETRIAALNALRLIKHKESVALLMTALRDDDIDIRRAATKSLLMNGTKDVTEHLLNYSEKEEDPELKALLKEAAISAKDRTPRI